VAQFDLPLDQLSEYRPELRVPDDMDSFWSSTLARAREFDLGASFTRVETGLRQIDTFDVRFAGFGGHEIRGWLHLPTGRQGALPAIVEYVGYGGGRGLPHERLLFAAAGYAHLTMDTRGQGGGWCVGDTPDPGATGEPQQSGFMTRGISDPKDYFYRRVYVDGVRAVEAVRAHPDVDPERVAITGVSQGGGITIAVAGLVPDLAAVAPDVPFLCDFPRATTLVNTDPYGEIVRYAKTQRDRVDRMYQTLSYFDGAVLAQRATAPTLFSVALMDEICPPSTVYAAYNHYGSADKEIRVYPFNGHEGGGQHHEREKLRWLAARLPIAG
jgi:cephalosporin-C deacetylase